MKKIWMVHATAVLFCLHCIGGSGRATGPRSSNRVSKASPKPVFSDTTEAANPERILLVKDESKVVGWISGKKSHAGRVVTVKWKGGRWALVVGKDNTFQWKHEPARGKLVRFSLGSISESIRIGKREDEDPVVFFVVDRPVVRAGQQLHFAGFLRRMDRRGGFHPIRYAKVEVRITSKSKGNVAAAMKAVSDGFGRIGGSYRFMEADSLDDYELTVKGYKGSALVKLAEFRKSKVKLVITGKVTDEGLRLGLHAEDFLKEKVPVGSIQLEAQVVRNDLADAARPDPGRLDRSRFALASAGPGHLPSYDDLPEDLRLLAMAGDAFVMDTSLGGVPVRASFKESLSMEGRTSASHLIKLRDEWLDGRHSVRVKAVAVDQNGREQRTFAVLPLVPEGHEIDLRLRKEIFTSGEPIVLTIQSRSKLAPGVTRSSVVVVMRLHQGMGTGGPFLYSQRLSQVNIIQASPNWGWYGRTGRISRSMVTARTMDKDTTTLRLNGAGAYKLVVVTRFSDGVTVKKEAGIVVQESAHLPALLLRLDRRSYMAGERLRGAIHSRFRNARILLTLYDGNCIRLVRPMQIKGSSALLDLELPSRLGQGAVVEVLYPDKKGRVHLDDTLIKVHPKDRVLQIRTEMDRQVAPGSHVEMKIQVDRRKPVDLVVSVYDASLLGIGPDRGTDIRSFFLADERARNTRVERNLHIMLGRRTLGSVLDQVRKLLNENKAIDALTDARAVRHLVMGKKGYILFGPQLAALLRLCGYRARWIGNRSWSSWRVTIDPAARALPLVDLLASKSYHYRLAVQIYGSALVITDAREGTDHAWQQGRRFRFRARGDAAHSVSANSFYSASAQSFISHLPASPASPLLAPEGSPGRFAVRTDFSDSAFWSADVRTNDLGLASVRFKLPDSITNWRVVITAVSSKMEVGSHTTGFRSYKPIMVWPMLPRVFTQGDRISVYSIVHNRTNRLQKIEASIRVKNGRVHGSRSHSVEVPAKGSRKVYWTFEPGEPGFTQILMTAACKDGTDASLKRLPVSSSSTEHRINLSGFTDETGILKITDDVRMEGAELTVTLSPSLAADMVSSLDYLVEYPYGCVEQTMSRFLPAIKVSETLDRFKIAHSGLRTRLPKVVAAGVKRLLNLQRPDGGWGWHGTGATHEMMTPYALYGLIMAENAGYDFRAEKAVKRGLHRLRAFIQRMGERETADRIYSMYVYSMKRPMEPEWWRFVERMLGQARLSDYALSLVLEMALTHGKSRLALKAAHALRHRAVSNQGKIHYRTAGFSRWGNDPFEITAAAMKALVANDVKDPLIPGILAFFASTKRGNRWNSTKDTAMITFAMADYLAKKKKLAKDPGVTLSVNGLYSKHVSFTDGLTRKLTVPVFALRKGVNTIRFLKGSRNTLFRAQLRYFKRGRNLEPMNAGIRVARRFFLLDSKGRATEIKPGDTVRKGSYIRSEVSAEAAAPRGGLRYVLVEDPKPSGAEILPFSDTRFVQTSTPYVLRETRTGKVVYHHQQTPQKILDRSILHLEFAGSYVVPPARVELMYETERSGHSGSFYFKVID